MENIEQCRKWILAEKDKFEKENLSIDSLMSVRDSDRVDYEIYLQLCRFEEFRELVDELIDRDESISAFWKLCCFNDFSDYEIYSLFQRKIDIFINTEWRSNRIKILLSAYRRFWITREETEKELIRKRNVEEIDF